MVDWSLPEAITRIEDNASHVALLVEQVRGIIGIIPFIGAGLSQPLGFPLWTTFLLDQAHKAKITAEIENLLADGCYEEAAEELLNRRGRRRFDDAILTTFGRDPGMSNLGATEWIPSLTNHV